jgi:hypothetical protein
MVMSEKWIVIGVLGFVFAMYSPIIISEHSESECKIAAINKGLSAEDILKLCKAH